MYYRQVKFSELEYNENMHFFFLNFNEKSETMVIVVQVHRVKCPNQCFVMMKIINLLSHHCKCAQNGPGVVGQVFIFIMTKCCLGRFTLF